LHEHLDSTFYFLLSQAFSPTPRPLPPQAR
jgi:hypothetical protein